ncbi:MULTISPECIES: STAS domain-containing protein [unclassified Streptomyces]|uniref:STAS domain-containing protein n=1 Tax=unclassified Streptomyces TaxID=2593676 RepID=UPI002251CF99|nr:MULTISPECIES: STAS domain-containing protein [unclassified Streptomyces]MCX4529550.1 STAS domain-containing protein [Streptomyces sp. NBC_01551]MCX4539877.1 STAS domain-containing protein [Streptomyces sp. NBC_01565]
MLPIKVTDSGVLIIPLRADLDVGSRAATAWAIDRLLAAHRSSPVVVQLSDAAPSPAAVSTVARTIRMCRDAGTQSAVVAAGAEARRTLRSGLGGVRAPDVHVTVHSAVATLSATVGTAA